MRFNVYSTLRCLSNVKTYLNSRDLCLRQCVRPLSTATTKVHGLKQPQPEGSRKSCNENEEFIQIFRFPHIAVGRLLCRLKLYQTGLTTGLVPLTLLLYANGQATLNMCAYLGASSVLALSVLYVVGNFFRRFVGAMYIDKTNERLKISHLTFFGNRRDDIVAVKDVIPFMDLGENPKNLYYTLKIYSTGVKYYYIVKFGGVLRPEEFKLAVGVLVETKSNASNKLK